MQHAAKKLEIFKDSILGEAYAKAQRIRNNLEAMRSKILAEAAESIQRESNRRYETRCAEITARETRRVSVRISNNHHTLLQYREDCANEVFDMASQRIRAFASSPEYPQHLSRLLQQAVQELSSTGLFRIYLRPEDFQYQDILKKAVPSVSLEFEEGAFYLGGLHVYCPSRRLRIDLSFDTAMSDLVGHFSEISGMHLEEI